MLKEYFLTKSKQSTTKKGQMMGDEIDRTTFLNLMGQTWDRQHNVKEAEKSLGDIKLKL